MKKTLFDRLEPDDIIAKDENGTIVSYTDLDEFSFGIKRCLVFILSKNCLESLLGYLHCLKEGIVPLMLSCSIDKELLNKLINEYKPQYIWKPIDVSITDYERVKTHMNYELLGTGLVGYDLHEDLALLLTTSGSTGSPKLVRQTYKNIYTNAQSISQYLELRSTEKPVTTLPMNYTYGLSIINSHLLVRATLLMTDKTLLQKEFWDFLKEEKVTSIAGVPYTYEILKKLRFFKMDLPHLITMTQAGGKLSPHLHKEFAQFANENNKRLYIMYGATEATARMAYLPYEKTLTKCGSIGLAIPGGELVLMDGDMIVTDIDVEGELVYRGDNVTLGYALKGEDLAAEDRFCGVYHTGDIAKKDEDGYFYIVGRMKRFIKIYGNRVSLDEVESILRSKFDIECACSGVDDHMEVYVTDDSKIEEVTRFLPKKIKLNSKAFVVHCIEEIPKNTSGKIDYKRLSHE